MSEKMEHERKRVNFNVEDMLMLLWNKKWTIIIVTLFFIIGGAIVFKVSRKPQFYKYTTNLTLQYRFDAGEGKFTWIECERLPWKMVKIDYSKIITDSIFLKELVSNISPSDINFSLPPIMLEANDSLHIAISLIAAEGSNVEFEILQNINKLFPEYIVNLQRSKLCLEIYLLEKKKNQVLLMLTNKEQQLQALLNKKRTIIDKMEIVRLENECQVLYNSSLQLVTQISTLQIFLEDKNLLVLKADGEIVKEQVIGGPFSRMSMFLLLFAFVGFMAIVNIIVIKAYLIDKR